MKEYHTLRFCLLFFPIMYNILPCDICANPIQGWEFGFLGSEEIASLFETHYIPTLWIPSLCKLRRSWRCHEANPIRPVEGCRWVRRIARIIHAYNSHSHCWSPTLLTTFASPSLYFYGNDEFSEIIWLRAAYLVFEVPGRSPRLVSRKGIPQNNAFASFINNILKKIFQMRHISTLFPLCNSYVLPFSLSELSYWNKDLGQDHTIIRRGMTCLSDWIAPHRYPYE